MDYRHILKMVSISSRITSK